MTPPPFGHLPLKRGGNTSGLFLQLIRINPITKVSPLFKGGDAEGRGG